MPCGLPSSAAVTPRLANVLDESAVARLVATERGPELRNQDGH